MICINSSLNEKHVCIIFHDQIYWLQFLLMKPHSTHWNGIFVVRPFLYSAIDIFSDAGPIGPAIITSLAKIVITLLKSFENPP